MLCEYSVDSPLNREPPAPELVSSYITPHDVAYDRNHGPLPHISPSTYSLTITTPLTTPLTITLPTLRSYPQHTVTAALQCAGNRRHTMRQIREVSGIDWLSGAVCNATWSGPLLADILRDAAPELTTGHACFNSRTTRVQDDDYYGVSVPLERCLDKEKMVLLALEMNGAPLTVNHGAPVRVVVPGVAGARWTKWLDEIIVQSEESPNYYTQRDYKILPPHIRTKEQADAAWAKAEAIMGMPVNSVVCVPEEGAVVKPEELEVRGYALPQGDDGPVVKVEISVDCGETWREAEVEGAEKWGWGLWRCTLPREVVRGFTGKTSIWSRATDKGGNRQTGEKGWNYRGVAYCAYGNVGGLGVMSDDRELVNGVMSDGGELANGVEKLKL